MLVVSNSVLNLLSIDILLHRATQTSKTEFDTGAISTVRVNFVFVMCMINSQLFSIYLSNQKTRNINKTL